MIAVTTGFETRLVKNGTKTPKRNKTKMLSGEHSKKIKKTKKKPKPLLQKIKNCAIKNCTKDCITKLQSSENI